MKLPALTAFRYFDVAARTGSFVRAAEQLHVTHGAVSRQVRLLEASLGVELFERRNRAIFLNAAGRALLATTQSVFEQLEGTVYRLQQQARENVLVLSCEPTLAMKWLIPRLPAFQAAHPDIQLHLMAAGGPVDFARSGVDLALRRDDFQWEDGLHMRKVCDEWVGPVVSPSRSLPAQGFTGQRLLHSTTRPGAWATWLRLSGQPDNSESRADYEHFYLCIQAAVAGLGVAMASRMMVGDELASGQLQAPHGFVRDGSAYVLLCPQPWEESEKCRRFADWVVEKTHSNPA
ncbi:MULTISPECIES: LysR substrate-binding domain-containing protein [unclassified Pseudomonas]|uniref:LysR substrate-binding domain-containing protein n=1 Tax=unclassified Pseudomonas TaxID=196821 RepID=UPI0021CAC714|nr:MULTISPECIES: LysR substrate-binding domain-containing protein [unclassified Pseudomonas]MCU1731582.1 LysR substrate-binding domain-containing protein [Pseudomonas sp. 20P_3.2_Bac4]MCU1745797.1 LysR substrate-binding domain-containing protein [Pseudomonas sp. 20P_3.2_Bac5]